MWRRYCSFLILTTHLLKLALASSGTVAASYGFQQVSIHQPATSLSPQLPPAPFQVFKGSTAGSGDFSEEDSVGGGVRNKLGSSPPSCDHKCYECVPCEAIQVPTISRTHHRTVALHYANYEPEGWRCKCGPFFFTP